MTPLLFALALAISPAASPPDQPAYSNLQPGLRPLGAAIRNVVPPPAACAKLDQQTVAPDGVRIFKKLNELPWGVMEHAVWRTVGGCPVREIVFGGQTYYLASAAPHVERLDPTAHRNLEKRFGF